MKDEVFIKNCGWNILSEFCQIADSIWTISLQEYAADTNTTAVSDASVESQGVTAANRHDFQLLDKSSSSYQKKKKKMLIKLGFFSVLAPLSFPWEI